jgi:enterochelin esterase-like enzyme
MTRLYSRRSFMATSGLAMVSAGCSGISVPGAVSTSGTGLTTTDSGTFHSKARNTKVGWTISYPPGLRTHTGLPLILALHGYGGNHSYPLGGIQPAQLLTMRPNGRPIPPVAVAAIDGGNDYWHQHPGDNPMAMLLNEFLPMCRARGLGRGQRIGVTGLSMGGYGALLLAEKHRSLVAAVGVMSPAIWQTYEESQAANPTAFTSPSDFAAHDVITHAPRIANLPVWVRSGSEDPFHPWVEDFAAKLPNANVGYPPGGHDDTFWEAHAAHTLRFTAVHLIRNLHG